MWRAARPWGPSTRPPRGRQSPRARRRRWRGGRPTNPPPPPPNPPGPSAAPAPIDALRGRVDGPAAGTGARATADPLAPGRHTVRLVATDGSGRHASAHVRVSVTAVTPQPLSIAAPAKLDPAATTLSLRVAAATACRLTVSGGTKTVATDLTRAPASGAGGGKPRPAALKPTLAFPAGRSGPRRRGGG